MGTPGIDRFKMAAGLLVVAAAGHAFAIVHHAGSDHGGAPLAAAFAAVAAAQLLGAFAVARGPVAGRRQAVVLIGSAVLIALWAVSRTVGLPHGPHPAEAEAVGLLDTLTVGAELGIVGLLGVRTSRRRRLPIAVAASAVVIVGVAALNVVQVAEPAGAVSHHPEQSGGGHGDKQEVGEVRSAKSAVETPQLQHEPADRQHGDAHADEPSHTHP